MNWIERITSLWWNWICNASSQLALLIVLIGILTLVLQRSSPRLRHSLWLVVLAKSFLPPSFSLPTGIGQWRVLGVESPQVVRRLNPFQLQYGDSRPVTDFETADLFSDPTTTVLFAAWTVGLVLFWLVIVSRYWRVAHTLAGIDSEDEGPLRIGLEKVAIELGISRCPLLRVTDHWTAPFLIGVIRPCIVLPEQFRHGASESDVAVTLAHELVHYRRRDIWIGWLQVVALSLFWFHPLVWWSMRQLRQCREEACDDAVLRKTSISPQRYGDAMLGLAIKSHRCLIDAAGLIGVFERGTELQLRLEKIMCFTKNRRQFGFASRALVAVVCLTLLPMASRTGMDATAQERRVPALKKEQLPSHPQIVSSSPRVGETDVKTSMPEIRVTFDRDMSDGMSWTGGPPFFPPSDKTAKARWIDKRTCVLPVKLEGGKFYRVGINSTSYNNFRAVDGQAALPTAIYFATEGASAEAVGQARTPEIVEIIPANGATDVDTKIDILSVTFNMPMNEGMSWTGGGATFPAVPEGQRPSWSEDKRTCRLPVALQPNQSYRLGLNSPNHKNFQSAAGVPLKPVEYSFQTK